jgi:hypothetical protein
MGYRRVFFSVVAALLLPLWCPAQTPPGSVKAVPQLTPEDHEQVVAYWTSETGWKSELRLRNDLVGQELTVTPAIRLPNGAETSLAAVTTKPQEVKSVDLDAAITAAAAPQLVRTYGSLVLRYRSIGYRNLYAALMVRNVGHPFAFHIDAAGESPGLQTGSREGVWWLPKDTTSDYLIVTNQGKDPTPEAPVVHLPRRHTPCRNPRWFFAA